MVHGLETMARLNAEASKPPGSDVDQIRSLQRELAEARAENQMFRVAAGRSRDKISYCKAHEAMCGCDLCVIHGMLDFAFGVYPTKQSAPGPSDAKGEGEALFVSDAECDAAWEEFVRKHITPNRIFKLARMGDQPTPAESKHIAECRSCGDAFRVYRDTNPTETSDTPYLTDEVEQYLRDLRFNTADDKTVTLVHGNIRGFAVWLRERGHLKSTPAEPAQKLVPLPEGARVIVPHDMTAPGFKVAYLNGYWQLLDPTLYGVDAERVRELEAEVARLTKDNAQWEESCGLASESAGACQSEAERLRKAIEAAISELTDQGPYDRPKIINSLGYLRSALTPPTATSEASASGEEECQCDIERGCAKGDGVRVEGKCTLELKGQSIVPPSAPAAESEGGDGWQSHKIHFDAREMAALESLAEGYGHTTWPDAIVRCKAERDSLSARLAACEERCKELEAGLRFIGSDPGLSIASRFFYDQLLAPKAEGGRA